jgi:hypothetical protein
MVLTYFENQGKVSIISKKVVTEKKLHIFSKEIRRLLKAGVKTGT